MCGFLVIDPTPKRAYHNTTGTSLFVHRRNDDLIAAVLALKRLAEIEAFNKPLDDSADLIRRV